jgi:hypothetical protein
VREVFSRAIPAIGEMLLSCGTVGDGGCLLQSRLIPTETTARERSKIDFNNDHGDFVYVNDRPEYPGGLMESAIIDREIDRLKNERDKKYPRGNRLC